MRSPLRADAHPVTSPVTSPVTAAAGSADDQPTPAERHTITLTIPGQDELAFPCLSSESVLAAMHRLGKRGIPLGCRSGGCGVCAVAVDAGSYTTRVMSRSHISAADEAAGRVLACRLYPRSDLCLRLSPKLASCLTAAGRRSV